MKGTVISFVAWSGTGKTTLVEKLIVELKKRGYRVGAIKCDAHRFEIDHPGKDSYRMAAAGADTVALVSGEKFAMVHKHDNPPSIEEVIAKYFDHVDIILVEGFKKSSLPKIEIYRKELGKSLICRGDRNDPHLLAVAANVQLDLDVPLYDIDDVSGIANFIEVRVLRESMKSDFQG